MEYKKESLYQMNEGFGHGFDNRYHLTNIPKYLLGSTNPVKPWKNLKSCASQKLSAGGT